MADKLNDAQKGLLSNKFFPNMTNLKKNSDTVAEETKVTKAKDTEVKEKPKAEKKPAQEKKEKPVKSVEPAATSESKPKEDPKKEEPKKTEPEKNAENKEEAVVENKKTVANNVNSPKLHTIALYDGKELANVNLAMPSVFRNPIEKIAKENERPLSYVIGLLLQYALEVNPMQEFPAAIGLSKENPWNTMYKMPVVLKEKIKELGDKNGKRPLIFTVNALIKYALETIGEAEWLSD